MLLDLVMPRCNGLHGAVRAAPARGRATPVIVLSGVTDIAARVQALDRGAVDVVAKPFSLAELLARIRRHLAAAPQPRAPTTGSSRPAASGSTSTAGAPPWTTAGCALTEREFALLAHLMRRRGDVCRREELLHDVWGLDFDPGSNVVEVCVRRLRNKLQPTLRSRRSAVSATASIGLTHGGRDGCSSRLARLLAVGLHRADAGAAR